MSLIKELANGDGMTTKITNKRYKTAQTAVVVIISCNN